MTNLTRGPADVVRDLPWYRMVSARLGVATIGLLVVTVAATLSGHWTLQGLHTDAELIDQLGQGRKHTLQVLYLAARLQSAPAGERPRLLRDIHAVMAVEEERFRALQGRFREAPGEFSAAVVDASRQRQERWLRDMKPTFARLLAAATPEEGWAAFDAFEVISNARIKSFDESVARALAESVDKRERLLAQQWVILVFVAVAASLVLWLGFGISRRVRSLAVVAERIAGGELSTKALVEGADEVALLAASVNTMLAVIGGNLDSERAARARLEALLATVKETSLAITSSTTEILAGTAQQAAAAQEQAAAVSQTVTTVDEVQQVSEQAAQRAKTVAESAQRTLDVGKSGRRAVDDALGSMDKVREQVEALAQAILALAEQAQAIGDITMTVKDIAEQTNMLALNAGIEAARAGEHGRGFAVVAAEVRTLAEQSKRATVQVRQILGDIQRATNSAVLSTEESTKRVGVAAQVMTQAGETIKSLVETMTEAAQAAVQTSASVGQQAAGMTQIHQAMKNINQATQQSLAATRQTEQAVQDLNRLGGRLRDRLQA